MALGKCLEAQRQQQGVVKAVVARAVLEVLAVAAQENVEMEE